MEDTRESDTRTINLCHKCCNPMERKVGSMKFRRATEVDDDYPGTLKLAEYFWCQLCEKAYMSPDQCDKNATRGQARNGELVFVLAPVQVPSIKVHIVDWLRE